MLVAAIRPEPTVNVLAPSYLDSLVVIGDHIHSGEVIFVSSGSFYAFGQFFVSEGQWEEYEFKDTQ